MSLFYYFINNIKSYKLVKNLKCALQVKLLYDNSINFYQYSLRTVQL